VRKNKLVGFGGVALLAVATLAGCGEAPEESASGGGGGGSDFLPCIVSDAGGFDDRSFNQLGFEGVQKAAEELGSDERDVESNSESDYAPNVANLVSEGCNVIVGVGFNLAAATVESAAQNPDTDYLLIDSNGDTDNDGTPDGGDNVKPLLYNTAEAAFLAGYAAADYSKTGVVGTYGGLPIPTVTIFMDGFRQGVEYYNEQKDDDVEVVGWDGEDGSFTGGFEPNQSATNTAAQLLDQDVDVILPVGGPIYQGALTAINDAGGDQVMIGTDADVFESDPNTQDVILTSVEKRMDLSTYQAVMAAGNDEFDPEPYIGTLENDGVALAPFHNYEDEVSDSLPGELEDIQAQIIDGSIEVDSYLND